MELRDYLRVLRAHWVGMLLVLVTMAALTHLYTLSQDKVYAANANGFVSTGATRTQALNSVNDSLAKSRAVSYVDIAKSRATAQGAARELGLDINAAALVSNIDVEQPPGTVLIKITARASTPQQAQALADAWVVALADQVDEIEDPLQQDRPGTLQVVPIESAALPTAPLSPQPLRNLLLGLAVGVLLALAYAAVRNVLDRRIRGAEVVESRFDVTVVGEVPTAPILGRAAGEKAELSVLVGSRDGSGAGEAFRKLRTNLVYMDVDAPPRVIVVTSPKPGEGKSTVSANLAAAIALSGQRVVLVDADLRRPSVATSLGVVEGVGLTDVLVGNLEVTDAIQVSSAHENLQVLGAGRVPPNPSELLGSRAMQALVEKLSADAFVILDAPPLLPVTDAAVLTARSDGALVVISSGATTDAELKTALSHLEAVQGRALGVIVNRVTRQTARSGYYSGYYGPSEVDSQAEPRKATPPPKHRRTRGRDDNSD